MGLRGPQSQSSMMVATAGLHTLPRIAPPKGLNDTERRFWLTAVDSLPADFFGAEHRQQLLAWVRHAAMAERLAEALAEMDVTSADFPKISAQQIAHSKAALAYSRSLRITVNSRADRDAAATKAGKGRMQPATIEQLRERYARDGHDA